MLNQHNSIPLLLVFSELQYKITRILQFKILKLLRSFYEKNFEFGADH